MQKIIKIRSIMLIVLLNILTLGFYNLYWMYKVQQDINYMDNNNSTSGAKVVIMYCVTFSLYGYYWVYNLGNRMKQLGNNFGLDIKNTGKTYLIYILCGTFTFGISAIIGFVKIIKDFNTLALAYNTHRKVEE